MNKALSEKYDADNFRCQLSIGYLIRRIHNILVPRMEREFENQEITFVQWIALMTLRDGSARTGAELSRQLNYDSGAITRLLDQLEKRGYLERVRSTEDRRVIVLTLTSEGASIAHVLANRVMKYWNDMLEPFSQAEFRELVSLLVSLSKGIEQEARGTMPPFV